MVLNPKVMRAEIAKLELAPGDVVVIKLPDLNRYLSQGGGAGEYLDAWAAQISERIGGNKVLVLDAAADLTVLKAA
jgi:hypothetical protein